MSKIINKFFNKYSIAIIMIAIFFIADRWLKVLALDQAGQPAQKIISQLLLFNFHPNYYIAFSLPLSGWPIVTLIFVIIISLILSIFYLILNKKKQTTLILLLTVILFGAISNILDRLLYGYVIDYLQLKYFAIFNLADVMISLSIIFLIKINLKKEIMDEKIYDQAENLQLVHKKILEIITATNPGERVIPTKENVAELITLHDLNEIISPANKGGMIDEILLKELLIQAYKQQLKTNKSAAFFNFRTILDKPEYAKHFKAMLPIDRKN